MNVLPIKGSTNALIKSLEIHKQHLIIKQYGFEANINPTVPRITSHYWKRLVRDYLELRNILTKTKINIPKLLNYGFISDNIDLEASLSDICNGTFCNNDKQTVRFVLLEEFVGSSYKQLCISGENREYCKYVDNQIKGLIKQLPENIELDIHPGNFTIINDSVYFIDLMPPKIQLYQKHKWYKQIFSSVKTRTIDSEKRRLWRYNSTKGRLQRFEYYKTKLKNEAEAFLQIPTSTQTHNKQ